MNIKILKNNQFFKKIIIKEMEELILKWSESTNHERESQAQYLKDAILLA
jgi:hypothetical protein